MFPGSTWTVIVEQIAEYEEVIDPKAFFDKVVIVIWNIVIERKIQIISLWKEYPNAISNRITTSVSVDTDSDLWNEVLRTFETHYKFCPRDCSEIAITKIIHKDLANNKFSDNAFEVSYYEGLFRS